MANERIFEDAFNLLCWKLLGEGIHRKVFECRIRDDLVVKVEDQEGMSRYFANVLEHKFWSDHQHYKPVASWLAPCEYLSPDGRISLQQRCEPLPSNYKLPDKLPSFLADVKSDNFGLLKGKLVCMDYAMTIPCPNIRLKKVHW